VPHSDRSKTPIEPYLSDQWFVHMADIADPALDAVTSGKVQFHPERYKENYLRWLGEKRDWCISRQLWWGHRIPVWRLPAPTTDEKKFATTLAAAKELAAKHPGELAATEWTGDDGARDVYVCLLGDDPNLISATEALGLERDPDVLDTWFSSGLWPLSTLGWPEETPELETFYPTTVLSTAREIITLWVARMVAMGLFCYGKVPFAHVYVHAVILDGEGRPMKKSLGNGVDPFDIIDKYGADALRFTLAHMATETQDVRLPVSKEKLPDGREINTSTKFELGRNFGTKIFNASKLILSNLGDYEPGALDLAALPDEDRWIIHRLDATTEKVTAALEGYQFSEATRLLYDFVWGELCDWHLEMSKPRFRGEGPAKATAQRVAAAALDQTLRLLHPFMPFVTEEIWQALNEAAPVRGFGKPAKSAEAIAIAAWPKADTALRAPEVAERVGFLQDVLRAVRNIRSQFNVNPKEEISVTIECDAERAAFLSKNVEQARQLAKVGTWSCGPDVARPPKSAAQVLPNCKVFVPLGALVDLDAEIVKQKKKRADVEKRLAGVQAKLANADFTSRAPADVLEATRATLAELAGQIEAIDRVLADLK
jgi:valyl-tRNA synthetase